jgi:ornithine carbamoyltransferase
MTRHFLEVDDLSPSELTQVLAAAGADNGRPLAGLGVAVVMTLPSTRTRNSTEMAVTDLGGHAVVMVGAEVGIDVRETAEDVARTLAQYHRLLCVRVVEHEVLVRMAAAIDAGGFDVPVVNLLSSTGHPVQALADLLTIADEMGRGLASLQGARLAWIGDSNNVARSLSLGAVALGMHVAVSSPAGYRFGPEDLERVAAYARLAGLGGTIQQVDEPAAAVAGAIAVSTDVWVSMGQEAERDERLASFRGFQVDAALVELADPDAVLLHCLPAHRGEEVTAEVLEGPRSRVWQQTAHRRTAMRGLLAWLLAATR